MGEKPQTSTLQTSSAAGVARKSTRGPSLYTLFTAAFLAAAIALFYLNPGVLQSLRFIAFDTYQRVWPAPAPADPPVRIIAIDEASLARLGQWPWPRSTMARLTDALGEAGASAIVFDVLFAEADRTSPEQMLQWLPQERAAALEGVIADWPTHDGAFAEALARNPVVLGAALTGEETPQAFPQRAGLVYAGDDPAPFLGAFPGYSGSVQALADAAPGAGFINWLPERDQVVRRVPLLLRQGEVIAPSLALEAVRIAEEQSTFMVRSSNAHGALAFGRASGVNLVRVGAHAVATDPRGGVWPHFRRGDSSRYISAWRVIEGAFEPGAIDGKIVIVGATAPGLLDLRATPIDTAIPGAEIQQQLIEAVLSGRFLIRPDIAAALELMLAIGAVLAFAMAAPRLTAARAALLGGALVLVIISLSVSAYQIGGLLFDPVFPGVSAFLFAAGSTVYLYRRTEMQRAQIRRAFSRYVSPSVVRQLALNPERLQLGGEVRDLTLLFCDVRNFTGIAEHMDAEEVTAFINSLLSPLTDVIIDHGGTIDKYMGDAIMAFWNAPLDDPDHARHACEASERMIERMRMLNQRWRAQAEARGRSFTDVAIGIGVNSGECCVGNLGSTRRFDYSAIGDNVNVTSRLEGLTKHYGLAAIMGEDTVARAPDIAFLEVDLVRVKGRAGPLRIYTPMALVAAPRESWDAHAAEHARFLAAYRAGRWDEARTLLGGLSACNIAALSVLYAAFDARLGDLAARGLTDWDGVYQAKAK
jgi:adenylate cyclase